MCVISYRQVAMATWRSDGIKFTQCVSGQKISIFAPVRKTMGWVKKWLTPFRIIVLTSSIIVQSLEIKLRAPAVGAKRLCFLIVTLDLPAHGGHSLYKYCATGLSVNFDAVFEVFFQKRAPFQRHYTVLIFVARWRHNFREIAVENCEKSKNRHESLCAPLRI